MGRNPRSFLASLMAFSRLTCRGHPQFGCSQTTASSQKYWRTSGRKGDHKGSGMVTDDGVLVLQLAGCGPAMNVCFYVVHLCSMEHTQEVWKITAAGEIINFIFFTDCTQG